VVEVNDLRKKAMATRIAGALGGDPKGKTVALLGLAFKPNTDDMRESPALDIVPALSEMGVTVRAFDPAAMGEAKKLLPDIVYCKDAYDAMTGADALAIVTEWNEFRSLDLGEVKKRLKKPIVVDLRNIYSPADMVAAGFTYSCIGRPNGVA
jgi:UDPglucose 6-dehydrogenase